MPEQDELVVYIDGRFVPSQTAAISILDNAFLLGDGVFDTVCAWNGKLFRLEEQDNRLLRSAHSTRMNFSLSKDKLLQAIQETYRLTTSCSASPARWCSSSLERQA